MVRSLSHPTDPVAPEDQTRGVEDAFVIPVALHNGAGDDVEERAFPALFGTISDTSPARLEHPPKSPLPMRDFRSPPGPLPCAGISLRRFLRAPAVAWAPAVDRE